VTDDLKAALRWGGPSWARAMAAAYGVVSPFVLLLSLANPTLVAPIALAALTLLYLALRARTADASMTLAEGRAAFTWRGGSRTILRGDVASSYEEPMNRAVVLTLRDGTRVSVSIADDEAREQLLARLGQTLDQRALVAPLRGTLGPFTVGLLSLTFSFFVVMPALLYGLVGIFGPRSIGWVGTTAPIAALVLGLAAAARLRSPRVRIGAEGIRIEGRLFSRTVAYDRIVSVRSESPDQLSMAGVELTLTDGMRVELPTVAQTQAQIATLIARIEEGKRRFGQKGGQGTSSLDNFARAGRPVRVWRSDLTQRIKAGGFREATIDPETLAALMADPSAPIDRRVAAALAMREVAPDARARVRVAVDRAVDPHVRHALEEAGRDEVDEDGLEQVLARAEAAEAAARKRRA